MKKKIVGSVPGNVLGMMADLSHKLQHGVITPEQLGKFLRGENLRGKNSLVKAEFNFSSILADWEKYYLEIHGLKTDFSGIYIPEAGDEFSWLICRPENFFTERAYSGGKKLYAKWKYTDTDKSLDDIINMSFGRDGKTYPYIVRVRPKWEADENLKNLSANQITGRNINTLCLTERLLLGDFLYWKYQRHLDVKTTTICTGSRYSDGEVPAVGWYMHYGEVHVDWFGFVNAGDSLRSREAVS